MRPTHAPRPHVFVVVMENRSYAQVLGSPYTASLAREYAIATDYHAISHPSLPNYLALTSGSTWGVSDDNYHVLPSGGLGNELTKAGVSWKAYAEGFTGNCLNSPYPYAVKHNPFAYYGGNCPRDVVPLDQLNADLTTGPPQLTWLIPGLCKDGHDCSSTVADAWLASTVQSIVNSSAWRENGVLFITWDEDDGGATNHVATLIVAPNLSTHSISTAYDHYSMLATIEDLLGVARLGQARSARPMTNLLK